MLTIKTTIWSEISLEDDDVVVDHRIQVDGPPGIPESVIRAVTESAAASLVETATDAPLIDEPITDSDHSNDDNND